MLSYLNVVYKLYSRIRGKSEAKREYLGDRDSGRDASNLDREDAYFPRDFTIMSLL